MPKYFPFKVAGYYLYYTMECIIECMHVHASSFEAASKVFADPYYIEIYDSEHSGDEDRYIAIGLVEDVLFVVFTERKESLRLISARLATEKERRFYYDSEV